MTIFQDKLLTRTDCDEAGDYTVPNVLSPRDLVFSPDVGQKLYHHHIGSLCLFISKVSSRIGVSLMGGQGIPLSLLPSSFLLLLSFCIPSPFSIPFSSYFLIPPFPLSHPNCLLFFHLPLLSPFSKSLFPPILSLLPLFFVCLSRPISLSPNLFLHTLCLLPSH